MFLFKPQTAAANPAQKARSIQITNFLQRFPTARAISPSNDAWDVSLTNSVGVLTMRVQLPPTFPAAPPTLQVLNPVSHNWTDARGNITRFNSSWGTYTSLAQIVLNVQEEFQRNPPGPRAAAPALPAAGGQPMQQQQQNWGGGPAPVPNLSPAPSFSNPHMNNLPALHLSNQHNYHLQPELGLSQPPMAQPAPISARKTQMPEIPSSFPAITSSLTTSQLELLVDTEGSARAYLELDQLSNFQNTREELIDSISEICVTKTSLRERAAQLQSELDDLRRRIAAQQEHTQELAHRQKQVLDGFSLAGSRRLFDRALAETEDEGDLLRDQYEDNVDPDDPDVKKKTEQFITAYIKKRERFHFLSAVKERLRDTYQGQLA